MINRSLRALSVVLMLASSNTFPMGNNNQDVLGQVLLGVAAGAVIGGGVSIVGVHAKNHLAQRLAELEAQKAAVQELIREGNESLLVGPVDLGGLMEYCIHHWSQQEAAYDRTIKHVKLLIAVSGSPLSLDQEATIVKETTRNAALAGAAVAVLYPILRSIGS